MARELIVKGGFVVTMDESLGDLTDDILVRDGMIAAVGVIPGLVDTHRHVWQGAIGSFTPQMTAAEPIYSRSCGWHSRRSAPEPIAPRWHEGSRYRRSRPTREIC
jgi:predicted amidohydrolase YtcJ